jgi:Rab GDP dissociation inhibitor
MDPHILFNTVVLFWFEKYRKRLFELVHSLFVFNNKLGEHFCFLLHSWLFVRKFGLDDNTIDFIGHAVALHRDDRYLNEPALDTVMRMKVIIFQNL